MIARRVSREVYRITIHTDRGPLTYYGTLQDLIEARVKTEESAR